MTAVWAQGVDGAWQPLTAGDYPTEQALHKLVAEGPQLLPLSGGPHLSVLGTEVQLGSGRVDVLAVESTGRLTVIEVKLAGNAEARRAVVAQVLSYAAYLQGLDLEYLESTVLRTRLHALGVDSVVDAVRQEDQEHAVDAGTFVEGLAGSLANGAFRLVVVLDSAPDELVQIVGYLETITDRIIVDLVVVVPYDVNGTRLLVPQRVDPGRRVAELSAAEAAARQAGALYPGSEEFRAAIGNAPHKQQELLEPLTAWAERLATDGLVALYTYRGKNSITTLLPRLRIDDAGLATVYQEPSGAYLQLWPTVFDRRAPQTKPVVEQELGGPIRHGKRIHMVSDGLLQALSAAYREANDATTQPRVG